MSPCSRLTSKNICTTYIMYWDYSQGPANHCTWGNASSRNVSIFGSRYTAWKTWYIHKSSRRDFWTTKPYYMTKFKFFLGLCNLSRRFVPNFACIVVLLKWNLETTSPLTLDDWTIGKSMRSKHHSYDCVHHRYWQYQDRTDFIRLKTTRVTSKSESSYSRRKLKDRPNPVDYWSRYSKNA